MFPPPLPFHKVKKLVCKCCNNILIGLVEVCYLNLNPFKIIHIEVLQYFPNTLFVDIDFYTFLPKDFEIGSSSKMNTLTFENTTKKYIKFYRAKQGLFT